MEAPLSSPSLNGKSQANNPSYFMAGSSNTSSAASSSAQANPPTTSQNQQQGQQNQQYQPAQQNNQQSQIPHNPSDGTSPFLRDFNLVAEAAKRAQMAVLMRDLEAVGL